MIRLPGRFIWLAQPRAASRSISDVLKTQCEGKQLCGSHHATVQDCTGILKQHDEPTISMIRDPYKLLMSRFSYAVKHIGRFGSNPNDPETFRSWFSWFKTDGHTSFGDHIAQYHDFVDHYFIYERGLPDFFDAVGISHVPHIPEIGRDEVGTRPNLEDLDPICKQLIDRRFSFDVKLYQEVASRETPRLT